MVRFAVFGMFGLALFLTSFDVARADDATPPTTPKKPVTDVYHGVKVVDPYRWLENGNDAAVQKWDREQNKYARHYLDKLPDPGGAAQTVDRTEQRHLRRLFLLSRTAAASCSPSRCSRRKISRSSSRLASADEPNSARIVVDPNKINAKGRPPSTSTSRRSTASAWPCRCRRAAARKARSTFTRRPPARNWAT